MADYIDRQKALKALRDYFDDQISWEGIGSFVAECCEETINDIPAADVRENVKGEWIGYPVCLEFPNAYADDHIVCSVCEECFSILDNDCERFYFCPNCGADMRGGKDG